jgi:hypothetical protein
VVTRVWSAVTAGRGGDGYCSQQPGTLPYKTHQPLGLKIPCICCPVLQRGLTSSPVLSDRFCFCKSFSSQRIVAREEFPPHCAARIPALAPCPGWRGGNRTLRFHNSVVYQRHLKPVGTHMYSVQRCAQHTGRNRAEVSAIAEDATFKTGGHAHAQCRGAHSIPVAKEPGIGITPELSNARY